MKPGSSWELGLAVCLQRQWLKHLGGSRSDDWNNILANQAINTLWLKHSDEETRDQQYDAILFALIGIGPRDELEGMIVAQLLAAHNAAMECYRRAMLAEQTFEARRENLSQANKLSRTYAALLDALNRHRGKGQQKVTVEHVHVHSGGQAIVGPVAPGRRSIKNTGELDAVRGIAYEPSTPMRSPDPGTRADRGRCEENGAVECMEGRPEAVLPSATRTPSGMVAIQQKLSLGGAV